MAGWMRGYDGTRPIHYEGAISHQSGYLTWHDGHLATDVTAPMYPSIDQIVAYAKDPRGDRPLIIMIALGFLFLAVVGRVAARDART